MPEKMDFFLLSPPEILIDYVLGDGRGVAYSGDEPFVFYLRPKYNLSPSVSINGNDHSRYDYYEQRFKNLKTVLEADSDYMHEFWAPSYYDARIESAVRAFSDKELFGRKAGEDISDHLIVVELSPRGYIIASYPDLSFLGKAYTGMKFNDYFAVGSEVQDSGVRLSFDSFPSDLPDSFSLTVEIPIKRSQSWRDLPFVMIDHHKSLPKEEEVLSATVQMNL